VLSSSLRDVGPNCKVVITHPEDSQQTIAAMWQSEQPTLMPVPQSFDGFVEYTKRVIPTCLVNFERNRGKSKI